MIQKNKLIASLMLSGTVLTLSAPLVSAAENSSSSTATSTSMSSKASSSSVTSQTKAESTSSEKESKNDPVQTLKEQKMIIKKIIAKGGSQIATVSEASETESKADTSSTKSSSSESSSSQATDKSSSNSSSKVETSSSESNSSATSDETPAGSTSSTNKKNIKPNSSSGSQAPGLNQSDFKGVPNSKFVVYDVTDTMNSVIKEKLGVNEDKANAALQAAAAKEVSDNQDKSKAETSSSASSSNTDSKTSSSSAKVSNSNKESSKATTTTSATSSSDSTKENNSTSTNESKTSGISESKEDQELISKVQGLRKGDTIRKAVSERAAKLNKDQMKKVAEITTDQNGTAETKLPIDGKYHAYYVVNTETAKESYATNSAPIVVITPVTDSKGMYAPEFTIYPKSDTLPKPKTPEETQAKMFQTGHEDQSFFAKVVNWLKDVFK